MGPCAWSRDAKLYSQLVGESFVPNPLNGRPLRRGDAELAAQLFSRMRERRHCFFARREENPTVQLESAACLENCSNQLGGISQIRIFGVIRRISGETRDGPFVIDNTNRYTAPPEASHDPEALIISSDHYRTYVHVWSALLKLSQTG